MSVGVFKAEKDVVPGVYRIVDGDGAVEATVQSLQADPVFVQDLAHNVAAILSGKKMKKLPFNGLSIHYQQPESGTVIRFRAVLGNSEPACVIQTKSGPLADRLVFDVLNQVNITGQDRGVVRKQGGPRPTNGPSSPR